MVSHGKASRSGWAVHSGVGVGGDAEMQNSPPVVSQNQEHVQDLKPNRWNGEEVDRDHSLQVILQEDSPGLRRWLPADHVFADAGLTDIDAEFERLAMDARRAP